MIIGYNKILATLATAGVVFLSVALGTLALQLRSDSAKITATLTASIQQTTGKTVATLIDLRRTVEIAGGTLNGIRDTIRDEQVTIQATNVQTVATMKGIDSMIEKANVLVAHTDEAEGQIVSDVHATIGNVQEVLGSANLAVLDIDKQVNDPAISSTLGHLNIAMDNIQGTTLHIDNVAAFYEKKLTSPRGFASTIFHGVLQLVTPGASVVTAMEAAKK